jgi:hypothetical protein
MPPLAIARATVAGATRTTSTRVTTVTTAAMAASMTPNGDKDNKDGICRRQQRRDIICRSKSAGKCNRQLISRGGHGLLNSRGSRAAPARGVPGNAAGSGTVKAAAVSIAGGGAAPAPRSWLRLRWGHKLMALRAGCLAHHTRLSPFIGVGAGITGPVSIGKDGGHGGWLVLGVERWWRCGLPGYKNEKGEGENLACGRG